MNDDFLMMRLGYTRKLLRHQCLNNARWRFSLLRAEVFIIQDNFENSSSVLKYEAPRCFSRVLDKAGHEQMSFSSVFLMPTILVK